MAKQNKCENIIDSLFAEANVVSTHDVAAAYQLSENEVRAYADDLAVARIGASFAWAQSDVEGLEDLLEEPEPEDDEDGDEDENEDEEDDENDEEDDEEEDDDAGDD